LGNGYYKVIAKHTINTSVPKGLDANNFGTTCGTGVVQQFYIGERNQQWRLLPVGGGFYSIAPQYLVEGGLNLTLDVNFASGLDGAPMVLCNDAKFDNQLFRLDSP
jgi:endoglucanase